MLKTEHRLRGAAPQTRRILALAAGAALLLVAWSLLPLLFGEAIVPAPWTVAARLARFLAGPDIYLHMAMTLLRTLIGFLIGLVLGTAAGIVSGRLLLLERAFFIPVSVIQGAPPLLWIIPLVLVLGAGGLAPVGVVFFVVLPVVITSVQQGMKGLDPAGLEMMKVYAPSRWTAVKEFYLPGLAAHFKTLILTGFLIGLKSSIIGEWFGVANGFGIGRLINGYFYTFDMPAFYAVALFYVLVVVALAWGAGKIGKRAFRRRPFRPMPGVKPAWELVHKRERPASFAFRSVSFAYGENNICDRLSFSPRAGRTAVLTGESGVGKTTLARLALGLLKPKAGRVAAPASACLIFQEDAFLNHRDCFGNAALAVRGSRGEKTARARAALNAVGLGSQARLFPDQLSGGMKKRLAFARALAKDPDLIILDEPFNKLHKKARLEMWDLFFEFFAGTGVSALIITHFPEELKKRKGVEFHRMADGKVAREN